jgi:hypothetical protein
VSKQLALRETRRVQLDGDGNGTLVMMPEDGEVWQVAKVRVSASSAARDARCWVYAGRACVDGTLSGSSGDSTDLVSSHAIDAHGNVLQVIWHGGDPGAVATAEVCGLRLAA